MKYTYVHHLNYCHWRIPGGGELGRPSIQNECFLILITSNLGYCSSLLLLRIAYTPSRYV